MQIRLVELMSKVRISILEANVTTTTDIQSINTQIIMNFSSHRTKGCCYWGRGVMYTRNACNLGKLDYYIGARAEREGRKSLYPTTNFCLDPEATCEFKLQ